MQIQLSNPSLNTQHLDIGSSQYQRGWERFWKTNQSMLLPAAVCVWYVRLPPPHLAGWQRASPHPWEAGRNPLLQIGKLRHGEFLSDFVSNHAVSE